MRFISRTWQTATSLPLNLQESADILRLAVDFHDKDFEDDIQLQCALKAKCTQLFTRNPNHYDNFAIAVVPPSAFVP